MADTAIEWTDKTWNPVVGCTKVSPGCKNCYAKTLHDQRHKAHRAGKAMPAQYAHPFEVVQLMPDRLTDPFGWRKPARVFVNSVSDLFHEDVPDVFLDQVFAVMATAGRHTFQVLTKRPERMAEYVGRMGSEGNHEGRLRTSGVRPMPPFEQDIPWPLPNVWLGTSAEDQKAAGERIPHLLRTPAAVRFLSCEPLLGPVDLSRFHIGWFRCPKCGRAADPSTEQPLGSEVYCRGCEHDAPLPVDGRHLHWVIVGGESGHGARPIHPAWVRSLRDQCVAAGVAFFFKQHGEWADYFHVRDELKLAVPTAAGSWGSFYPQTFGGGHNFVPGVLDGDNQAMLRVGKKAAGRLLDGRLWDEFPAPAEGR